MDHAGLSHGAAIDGSHEDHIREFTTAALVDEAAAAADPRSVDFARGAATGLRCCETVFACGSAVSDSTADDAGTCSCRVTHVVAAFDACCRACAAVTRDVAARAGAACGAIGSTGASVCGRSETDGAAGRGSCRARDAPGALESQNAACAGTCVDYAADHSGNAESS